MEALNSASRSSAGKSCSHGGLQQATKQASGSPKRLGSNQGNPIENRKPIQGWVWCFMIDTGSYLSTWLRLEDSTGSLSHPPVAGEEAGRNVTEPGNRTALT